MTMLVALGFKTVKEQALALALVSNRTISLLCTLMMLKDSISGLYVCPNYTIDNGSGYVMGVGWALADGKEKLNDEEKTVKMPMLN